MNNTTVWVLTKEVNAYDQYGEYFVDLFPARPTYLALTAAGVPVNRVRHVMNGGGRKGIEDEWFHLHAYLLMGNKAKLCTVFPATTHST